MTVLLERLPLGVEGEPADIAPFACLYRKGAGDNPWETRWLEPTDDMLCGLLWEEKPLIDRVEAEFEDVPGIAPDPRDLTLGILSGGLYPRRVHPTETINWYARDKRALRRYLALPEVGKTARGTVVFTFRHDAIGRPGNFLFPAASLPMRNHPVQAISLHCRGANQGVAIPTLRVYGPVLWARPRTLDIEWGLANDLARKVVNGWIEAHYGNITKVEALAPTGGVAMAGAHHWRERATAPGRRGIRVTVMPMAGPPYHRTAVNFYATDVLGGAYDEITTVQPAATLTLWTSIGSASVALGDLDRGPIYIPSLGILVAPADSGVTGREFLVRLAAGGAKTVRQRVREHPEQTYAGAMAAVFGEAAGDLPPFPEPPYEPPMRIDVPEPALVGQWRLGAWHLKRWSRRMADNIYAISIWPFRDDKPTCIAAETQQIIKTFDLLGLHDMAEGGLNYWFAAKEYAAGGNEGGGYGNYFSDFDGFLLTDQYDMRHVNGHAEILQAVALHHRITGDSTWARNNAARLRQACEWIVRQRRQWNAGSSSASWAYGLLPPSGIGDGYGLDTWFCMNAEYCLGLRLTADLLAEIGMEGAEEFQAEAERYRQDIRAAAERSIALSPVLPVSDGTYRRYMPPGVYMRKSMLGWHKEVTSGAMWLVGEDRIFGANEPIARELLDVVEEVLQAGDTQTTDWLSKGGTGSQTGWERHKALYLLCDDIPPFLRALYNGYAGDSQPWEAIRGQPSYRFQDGHLAAGAIAGRAAAYTFWEHPQGGAADKTHGEAVFLEYVRNMLVMEIGDALWLARATPRPWLEQGKTARSSRTRTTARSARPSKCRPERRRKKWSCASVTPRPRRSRTSR
jgi:hypothetical protein